MPSVLWDFPQSPMLESYFCKAQELRLLEFYYLPSEFTLFTGKTGLHPSRCQSPLTGDATVMKPSGTGTFSIKEAHKRHIVTFLKMATIVSYPDMQIYYKQDKSRLTCKHDLEKCQLRPQLYYININGNLCIISSETSPWSTKREWNYFWQTNSSRNES